MDNNFYRKIHIYFSLLLFVVCLLFPAFYIRETRESVHPIGLLSSGWLGPIEGYFSWYANPLYVFALIFYKKRISPILAFLAVLLSLSFLLQKKMIVSELPAYADIKSYGIGYFLWVTSFCVLFIGQAILLVGGSERYAIFCIGFVVVISSGIFTYHFVFSKNSQYKVMKERDSIFTSQCKKSTTEIYATRDNPEGIYFEPDFGVRFIRESFGNWRMDGVGVVARGELNSGNIRFYEELNDGHRPDHATNKYVRYYLNDLAGVPVDDINSEVSVRVITHKFQEWVNIRSETVVIFDNKKNAILAESTYTFDPESGTLCSSDKSDSHYSAHDLLRTVLKFNERYESIYHK